MCRVCERASWAARRNCSVYLGTRRIEGDMRLNVFDYPIYGWFDAVVLNLLMGPVTVIPAGRAHVAPAVRSPTR